MKKLEVVSILIAAILSAVVTYKWQEIDYIGRAALIFTILTAVLIAINAYRQAQKEKTLEKVNASFGDIRDLKGATTPILSVGSSGSKFILADGVFHFPPKWPNIIKIYVKEKKLYINVVIRDGEGKPIAAIYENTWKMYQKGFEYNNDDNAFEIVTEGNLKVYFQVQLKDGEAQVAGLIFTEHKFGLYFYEVAGISGGMMEVITPEKLFELPEDVIPRIFKYPREKYFGIRNF